MTDDESRPDPRPKAPSRPPTQRPVPMRTTTVAGPPRDDSTTPRSTVGIADPAAAPDPNTVHPGPASPGGGPPRPPMAPWVTPDEWVEVGPRSGPLRRLAFTFGALAIVLVLLSAFVLRWLNGEIHPAGDPGQAVTFTIATGASTNDVASDLAAAGIVGNPTVFRYWLRREAGDISFQAGEYDLRKRTDFPELLTELRAGPKPPVAFKVLIPPGLTVAEMKQKMLQQLPRFDAAEFDKAIFSAELNPPYGTPGMVLPVREGLLFPDTYSVDENSASNELALLRRMRAGMDKVLTDLNTADKAKTLGLDTYKILVVASLIEEEAKVDGDRAKISRVIYNRLAANEQLGIDASTRFAVGKTAGQPLTQSDLDVDSGWNTRRNRGLPPTPIASPSRKSIEAALNPADGPWFYYVLTDEGGVRGAHTFATTAREFEAAKKICIDKGYCWTMPVDPPRLALSGTTRLAAVIGDPVRHSLSPAIHNAAFAACGLDWCYLAFVVPAGGAAAALAAGRTLGLGGLSVTMPHKDAVAAAVDDCSATAALLGAVNCVVPSPQGWRGENTDGAGFLRGLHDDAGLDPAGLRCLVLGAGGAARAVIAALHGAGAGEIVVVNRSPNAARTALALAGPGGRLGTAADVAGVDLIVNATPMGMAGPHVSTLPCDPDQLHRGQVVVDLVYEPGTTELLRAARARGVAAHNGSSMLVHQAAVAFELWTGLDAPVDTMRAAATAALEARASPPFEGAPAESAKDR